MDPRLIPPGTLPPPNGAAPVQQRPNVSYFLFLSLMFYLLNYNNSGSSPLTYTITPPSSNSTDSPYAVARYRLLLREARYEGLSRWLGASNQSTINADGWLNSTHFPDTTTNSSTALKVTPFEPENPQEPSVVIRDRLAMLMTRPEPYDAAPVYPQNLTGFVKGHWQMDDYSYSQLNLNETWQVETRQRTISDNAVIAAANSSANSSVSRILQARQHANSSLIASDNSTLTPNSAMSDSNSTFEQVSITLNRTDLRGSFPFSFRPRIWPNKALFNLREVQTSATGPVVLPSESGGMQDDSRLLTLRDSSDWQDWEKRGPVTYLGGDLTLSVEEGGDAGSQMSLDIEAAHLISSGLLFGYATPSFVRSHLVETVSLPFYANASTTALPDLRSMNLTAHAIGRSMLKEVTRRLQNDVDRLGETVAEREREQLAGEGSNTGSDDSIDAGTSHCVFRFYGSLAPLPASWTPALYSEFYASLFRPDGSSLPSPPKQTLQYILSSTNCGLVIHGQGNFLPTPLLWTRTKDFALLIGFAQLVLVVLLVRHLEKTASRPGTIVNVASASIGIGCIVDAYVFVLLLTAGVVTSTTRSSLPLFIPSFLALLSSLLFGMRYVSMIRAATPPPSRPAAPTPVQAGPSLLQPTGEDSNAGGTNRPASGALLSDDAVSNTGDSPLSATAAPATSNPVDESISWASIATSEKVKIGFMLLALIASIAIIIVYGWIAWLLTIIYSYWIPQITLNVQRGTARQSLTTEFVAGTTFARLILPVYFYGYSDNILDVDVSPWIFVLIVYSASQAAVLVLQTQGSFGARFFLPQRALDFLDLQQVHTWDYHQALPPSKLLDIEISLREEGHPDLTGPNCSICMDTVEIRPTKQDQDLVGSVAANERVRATYAFTPCGHLLHSQCLQEWMNVRAICPECRKSLPSLS